LKNTPLWNSKQQKATYKQRKMGKVKQERPTAIRIPKALFRYGRMRGNHGNRGTTYKDHLVREYNVQHRNGKIILEPNGDKEIEFDGGFYDDVDCIVHIDPLDFTGKEYEQIISKLRNAIAKYFDIVHEQFILSAGCVYLKRKIPSAKVASKIILENMHKYDVGTEQDDELKLPHNFEMLLRELTPPFNNWFGSVDEQDKL
jgi:hypothetical protein